MLKLRCLLVSTLIFVIVLSFGIYAQVVEPLNDTVRTRIIPPHPPGTGFVPPAFEFLHLAGKKYPEKPDEPLTKSLPSRFDWRASGENNAGKKPGCMWRML